MKRSSPTEFEKSIDPTDLPPMYVLEFAYVGFMESVNALKTKTLGKIEAAMRKSEEIGLRAAINQRIENFQSKLTAKGLDAYCQMVDRVKATDEAWRIKHPRISAQFPAGGEYVLIDRISRSRPTRSAPRGPRRRSHT